MARKQLRGEVTSWDDPVWEPLLALIRVYVDDFMWMFSVTLEDGTKLHAYKHWETRRYLYLSEDGRAFVYGESGLYRETDTRRLVDLVLPMKCDLSCRE